jgi:hypothetical protein
MVVMDLLGVHGHEPRTRSWSPPPTATDSSTMLRAAVT